MGNLSSTPLAASQVMFKIDMNQGEWDQIRSDHSLDSLTESPISRNYLDEIFRHIDNTSNSPNEGMASIKAVVILTDQGPLEVETNVYIRADIMYIATRNFVSDLSKGGGLDPNRIKVLLEQKVQETNRNFFLTDAH